MSRADLAAGSPAAEPRGEVAPPVKKLRFKPSAAKRPPPVVPRASEIVVQCGSALEVVPMPAQLRAKLSLGSPLVLGLDVATNDWTPGAAEKGSIGEHGHYHLCRPCDLEARVVQITWMIRNEAGAAAAARVVKPDGWTISEKALRYHGISQEAAEERGSELVASLRYFMRDVRAAGDAGGRLVAHHLGFHAGLPLREMQRAGLDADGRDWRRLVRVHGFCAMCPQPERWHAQCLGRGAGTEMTMNTSKLKDLVAWLLPELPAPVSLAGKAQTHVDVYVALLKRAGGLWEA